MNGLKQFRNEPNPIVHQLELTPVDYIVSFVLGIVLVPIRLILVLAVMIVAWIGALIFTSNRFKNKEGEPNSKLRLKTYEIFLKLIAWISGLIITVDGEHAFIGTKSSHILKILIWSYFVLKVKKQVKKIAPFLLQPHIQHSLMLLSFLSLGCQLFWAGKKIKRSLSWVKMAQMF